MLVAKYKSGSSLILDHPNDIDYIYYYESKVECRYALMKNKERDKSIHFATIENAKAIHLGCYIYQFMELIEGQDLEFDTFDFLSHSNEWKEIAKKYAKTLSKDSKLWYHILIGLYFIQNKKMKLTKKQLENVNKVHDKKCIDSALYDYIIACLR